MSDLSRHQALERFRWAVEERDRIEGERAELARRSRRVMASAIRAGQGDGLTMTEMAKLAGRTRQRLYDILHGA